MKQGVEYPEVKSEENGPPPVISLEPAAFASRQITTSPPLSFASNQPLPVPHVSNLVLHFETGQRQWLVAILLTNSKPKVVLWPLTRRSSLVINKQPNCLIAPTIIYSHPFQCFKLCNALLHIRLYVMIVHKRLRVLEVLSKYYFSRGRYLLNFLFFL